MIVLGSQSGLYLQPETVTYITVNLRLHPFLPFRPPLSSATRSPPSLPCSSLRYLQSTTPRPSDTRAARRLVCSQFTLLCSQGPSLF